MSTIIMIFIILVVSIAAISWYQANVQTGASQQEQLGTQSDFYELGFRLENAKNYLHETFYMAAMNGSDHAGSIAGRYPENHRYRHWLCTGTPQVPPAEVVRYTASNKTNETYKTYVSTIRGIQGQTYYDLPDPACVETSQPADPDAVPTQRSHHFSSYRFSNVTAGFIGEGLERSVDEFKGRSKIQYNRYWYMYDRLQDFIANEDPSSYVSDALSEIQDGHSAENPACIRNDKDPNEECDFPEPWVCEGISSDAESKVAEGLQQMINELESNQDYFNGTSVSCGFENNQGSSGADYPGIIVSPAPGPPQPDDRGQCEAPNCDLSCGSIGSESNCDSTAGCAWGGGSCGKNDSVSIDDQSECEGTYNGEWEYGSTQYGCVQPWQHQFTAYVDITLTCEDQQYRSVPKDDLEPLSWEIDLSFTASNTGNGNTRNDCPQSGGSIPPFSHVSCGVSEPTTPVCDSEVDLDG